MDYQLITKAKNFATAAHESIAHKRKYTNEPYTIHIERVAYLVSMVTDNENAISAAWLHDVLEDVAPTNNQFDEKNMEKELGKEITSLVIQLTDTPKMESVNRAQRKAIDRERLRISCDLVKTIKLADIIDNTLSITEHDKNFSIVYLREIEILLPYLIEGNRTLYKIAADLIARRK